MVIEMGFGSNLNMPKMSSFYARNLIWSLSYEILEGFYNRLEFHVTKSKSSDGLVSVLQRRCINQWIYLFSINGQDKIPRLGVFLTISGAIW